MDEMTPGPETILLPPPEKLIKRPETIAEADRINPITKRLREGINATFFNSFGVISQKGREFINQNLFDDLYVVYDRDLGSIQRDLDAAREIYTEFTGQRMLNFLQARLDYQIAWQVTKVLGDSLSAPLTLTQEEILQKAQTFRGQFTGVEINEALSGLKVRYNSLLEKEIRRINDEIRKDDLELEKLYGKPKSPIELLYEELPKTIPEQELLIEPPEKLGRQIIIQSVDRKNPRKLNIGRAFKGAVLTSAMILLLKAMNQEGKVDATFVESVFEPPPAADAFSGVVDTAAAGKAEKLGSASAVGISRKEMPKSIPEEYYQAVKFAQEKTGVPRSVILGIFRQESSMGKDPNLLASKDLGPAQIKASTWATVKERIGVMVKPEKPNPNNPRHAALAAALVLKDSGFVKDAKRAIRTYHRGLGHWQDKLGKDYYDKVLGYAVSFEEALQQAGF